MGYVLQLKPYIFYGKNIKNSQSKIIKGKVCYGGLDLSQTKELMKLILERKIAIEVIQF